MDSAMEFVAEAVKWRAVGEAAESMAVVMAKHPKIRIDKKSQLEKELLEGTINTTTISQINTTTTTVSHLDEFMTKRSNQPTLKVLGKRQSPYPRYDVLGEFLTKVPMEGELSHRQNIEHLAKQSPLLGKQPKPGKITAMIDLKKYAKSRSKLNNSCDKENQPNNSNQFISKDNSYESCKSTTTKNLQSAFDRQNYLEQERRNQQCIVDMFQSYESTPSKCASVNITQLDPVLEQPQELESSKVSVCRQQPRQQTDNSHWHTEQQTLGLEISHIPYVDEQESELLELESIMLEDLKNDLLKLSWKMSPAASSSHHRSRQPAEEMELDYSQIRNRVDGLRRKICSQHLFLH